MNGNEKPRKVTLRKVRKAAPQKAKAEVLCLLAVSLAAVLLLPVVCATGAPADNRDATHPIVQDPDMNVPKPVPSDSTDALNPPVWPEKLTQSEPHGSGYHSRTNHV